MFEEKNASFVANIACDKIHSCLNAISKAEKSNNTNDNKGLISHTKFGGNVWGSEFMTLQNECLSHFTEVCEKLSVIFTLINFSNSLMIHQKKQRKSWPWRRFGNVIIIVVKSGEHSLWISARIYWWFEVLHQTVKRVFHLFSIHLKVFFFFFSQLLGLWKAGDFLPCVWYISVFCEHHTTKDNHFTCIGVFL